jgi:hypothetical protein
MILFDRVVCLKYNIKENVKYDVREQTELLSFGASSDIANVLAPGANIHNCHN